METVKNAKIRVESSSERLKVDRSNPESNMDLLTERRLLAFAVSVLCLLVFLSACTLVKSVDQFADIAQATAKTATYLDVPDGSYRDAAWVDDDMITFLYSNNDSPTSYDYRVALHTPSTGDTRILLLPTREECRAVSSVYHLSRLPNNRLGFIFSCHIYHDHVTGEINSLYMWDHETDALTELQRYPENFAGGSYTFAPDMSQLLQGTWTGPGADQLYRVTDDGQMERLLPEFQQAYGPSWSPDGTKIAFMGLKTYQDEVETVYDVGELLRHPQDLYIMDANRTDPMIFLASIGFGGGTRWSPDGQWLSFSGEYQNAAGSWVINTSTSQVVRIWPYQAAHDWSPDGTKMVIIESVERNGVILSRPVSVELIASLSDNQ
ncbi:MAG: TolB family protein [Anaerolineales bacterium]